MRGVQLYIVGAGGFGRETLDAALAAGERVQAFLDDSLAGETRRGLPIRAPDTAQAGGRFIAAIANPHARRELVARLTDAGLDAATLVHPRAVVAPDTTLGPGCVVLAGAYISSSVTLGAHVHVNYNATVGHDTVLGDFTTVHPGGNVSGAVHLAAGAVVGANAVVLQGRRVGKDAFVGAGAVVTHDVEPHTVVVGVPARVLRAR